MNEAWRAIYGYEDRYKISTFGRVFSLSKERMLKPQVINSGYEVVHLYRGGKHTRRIALIHRLVARTFLPEQSFFIEINHLDGDKLNNHINNLEWCSRLENVRHAKAAGLVGKHKSSIAVVGTPLGSGDKVRYPSQRDAEVALSKTGKQSSAIHHFFKGLKKSAYGYAWEHAT